jgi:pyruvate kinase
MHSTQAPHFDLWYTLGPASLGKERDLLRSGANGVRLTFGFGTPALHHERALLHRSLAAELGRQCLTVADLNGEKFRLGSFEGPATVSVAAGTVVHLLAAQTVVSTSEHPCLPIPNRAFFSYLKNDALITVGDGAVLRVMKTGEFEAYAEMIGDSVLNHGRGLTIQGEHFRPRSLTPKDRLDLAHVLASPEYDVVALSFVSSAEDVLYVKRLAREAGRHIVVLAKIETLCGLEHLKDICEAADMVMAARGDLALTMPWVELPAAVDHIASTANSTGTPWILATQIVEGLDRFAIPTRAEICDVAQWRQKNCVGVLLSTETAFGPRPVDAVACTSSILQRYEQQSPASAH